ncbi:MAG: PilC/PilY family type IV pilus protein [Methylococcales bacterium]|nr:PilC/PilY family type IV pilus protein [Methylococcales bacterium]
MNILKILLLFSIILSANSYSFPSFTPNSQPTGWLTRPALSNPSLLSGNEFIYLINYDKDTWSGDVLAKTISNLGVIGSAGPWAPNTAASTLDALVITNTTSRKIVTRNATGIPIPFRLSDLTGTQKTDLGSVTTEQQKILDYVRGDRTNETPPTGTGTYRERTNVLGDILHSTLTYYYHDASTKRIYVGANDGMLHVFNATDGSEVFAYIPSMLLPNLKLLANVPYGHQYFVDGGLSIAKVNMSGTIETFLVGGLGAGGKGLYALNVTDPNATDEAAAKEKIKWEITSATTGYSNLGYTYGTPSIARLNDGTAVAIVSNGYMNSGNGRAVLYLINIDTGALVKDIDTGYGTTVSPNGLSTPTLFDSNSDGKVDYAYAGDLDGHLFKFDLNSNTPSNYSVSVLFTTNPVQPITSAPAVTAHLDGAMVAFATGKLLSTGDTSDATTVYYAYGIWDRPSAYAANSALLTQTLATNTYGTGNVRTITANDPNWTAGIPNHYGWKVALPMGERVAGERPFEKNGRFYFLTANPAVVNATLPNGSNWMYELDMITGGSPTSILFDLNEDGAFNSSDLVSTGCTVTDVYRCIPVAKPVVGPGGEMGGVSSQPSFVEASGYNTTLYTYHPDTMSNAGTTVYDPGVSGGHFDFDNYYYGNSTTVTTSSPSTTSQTKTVCVKTSDVQLELDAISPTYCKTSNGFSSGYTYMKNYVTGSNCGSSRSNKKNQAITCNTVTTTTSTITGDYLGPFSNNKHGQLHVHEYDDIYDVTGVNMLNASDAKFNLSNAITDSNTNFIVLVMNQYLNPAAKISVGGLTYDSVKTYKNLASETNASTLLAGLPKYTRANVGTLILNLPLEAFKSKDWWGDEGSARAGLMPTVYSCVVYVNTDGSMYGSKTSNQPTSKGLEGPNGERFDGALAIQLIKDTTPSTSLELNFSNTGTIINGDGTTGSGTMSDSQRARYGWRVKAADFKTYVLAEYTIYWHHPNGKCYGKSGWVADAPEDTISDAVAKTKATGSADPTDGVFASGLAVLSKTTTTTAGGSTKSGGTTTTTINYADGTHATTIVVNNGDGSTTTTTTLRDGTSSTETTGGAATSGSSSIIKGAEEVKSSDTTGRQSWWEIFQ